MRCVHIQLGEQWSLCAARSVRHLLLRAPLCRLRRCHPPGFAKRQLRQVSGCRRGRAGCPGCGGAPAPPVTARGPAESRAACHLPAGPVTDRRVNARLANLHPLFLPRPHCPTAPPSAGRRAPIPCVPSRNLQCRRPAPALQGHRPCDQQAEAGAAVPLQHQPRAAGLADQRRADHRGRQLG